jgi:hypothetical protein
MRQNTQNGTYITIRILKLIKEHKHNTNKYIRIRMRIKLTVKNVQGLGIDLM